MSRGTGRIDSDRFDTWHKEEQKKRPGMRFNTRTMRWEKMPPTVADYSPQVLDRKKKKEEEPTEMQFTSTSPEKLKIKKKSGKRDFRYKGSMGTNQQRGLSGLSIGGL